MKNISLIINDNIITIEHRIFHKYHPGDGTKTFVFSINNGKYNYPIDFIEAGAVTDARQQDYCYHFERDLQIYKAAVDKFKKLMAFLP
jgi:hypothetical protein